jgi:phenylpropionate dioxygenase-like ring-hydroxylating dioxygenase large terminal subunit
MTYEHLVDAEQGVVSRDVFVSDDVYAHELERIFPRAWLFVGHEDQIPAPGDFVTSRMGEESVIVCRDRQGTVHVFLNTCRHRGMKVCRYDQGNTPVFTCPYHAWSYSLTGALVGVPGFQSYYDGILDRSQWGLVEVPHMAIYKGTIWATWEKDAVPLAEYLGGIREHLDDVLDGRDGSEGNSQMLGGVQKWTIPSNWKFGVENFIGDTYHGNPTHRSVQLIGIGPSGRSGQNGRRAMDTSNLDFFFKQFEQGHGTWGFHQNADLQYKPQYADSPATEEYFRRCFEERRRRLGEGARRVTRTGSIFPNFSYHPEQPRALFVWHPNGPASTEVWKMYLVDRTAPDEVKDFLRRFYLRYAGPAGMTEQDDMENWNYATAASRGTIARRYPYNYQLSLGRERRPDSASNQPFQASEQNQRNFFRVWSDYMNRAHAD